MLAQNPGQNPKKPSILFILILLEISRLVAAKKLSAASFQQQQYHRGYVG